MTWLTEALNGPVRIGLPWASLLAFIRIRTHPRAYEHPLNTGEAWDRVSAWLATAVLRIADASEQHDLDAAVIARIARQHLLERSDPPA